LIGEILFAKAANLVLHGLIGQPFTSPCSTLSWNNNSLGNLHGLHGQFLTPTFNSATVFAFTALLSNNICIHEFNSPCKSFKSCKPYVSTLSAARALHDYPCRTSSSNRK
jgi:hypothetical protein